MVETQGTEIVATASDANELVEAQHATIAKVIEKQRQAEDEMNRANEALEAAGRHPGLSADAAKRIARKAEQRLAFVTKVRAALEAGYLIVPNFRSDPIAVRVKATRTHGHQPQTQNQYRPPRPFNEKPDVLAVGEGRYVSAQPNSQSYRNDSRQGQPDHWITYPTTLEPEVTLPAAFVKTSVVERTGAALEKKIFDEISVTADWSGTSGNANWQANVKGDPMVVGRIIDKSRPNHVLSFLIAWFLDTSVI